jgi:hypothetical protein
MTEEEAERKKKFDEALDPTTAAKMDALMRR